MKTSEIVKNHISKCDGNPSIYCGTYAKYNNGSLYGAWLDLSTFADADEFFAVCRALHSDERDPEFMFQDYECFPRKFYSESMNTDEVQDIIDYFNDYSEEQREVIEEYWSEVDDTTDPQTILDRLVSTQNMEDFAYDLCQDLYGDALKSLPSFLESAIDWERVARDLSYDCRETSNYIFSC